jgi:hypothetical protein
MIFSSLVMFASLALFGCIVAEKIALKPIPPVDAAIVSQPVLKDEPKVVPTITMHSGESCPPCERWIANDMASWQRVGWTVEIVKESTSSRLWPWYEILDGDGLRFEVDGPLTKANYERERKKALGK